PDVDDLTPGQVLADASVAEFIKSLGLSIAEAQKALDDNSVNQIGEFITPRDSLGGKTLLEMGLSPAFYHYQHADITCSMQLSLRIEKNTGVGVNLSGSFSDTSGENRNQQESSQSSESGSSTRTEERSASLQIQSASLGTVTIGGRNFQLQGDDPLTRIRALQDAVTADPQTGVEGFLYDPGPRTFTITTDAPADKVHTTSNTVAFIGGGFDKAVIQVGTNVNTDYVFNGSTTVSTTAQGDLAAYAAHVHTEVNGTAFAARLNAPTDPLMVMHFRTGRDHLEQFTAGGSARNVNISDRLRSLARFIVARNLTVEVEGYADAQRYRGGQTISDQRNVELGRRRATTLRSLLIQNGVPEGQIQTPVQSRGATDANADVRSGGSRDNVEFRRAEIRVPGRSSYYIFCDAPGGTQIESFTPDLRASSSTSDNGFIFVYDAQPLSLGGNSCTIDGTNFPFNGSPGGGHSSGSPEAHAFNLKTSINGNGAVDFEASADGNVVTVFGKTTPFQISLVTAESRNIQLSGSEGITVTEQFSRSESSNLTQQNTGNRTVAVGASVDVRVSRQFEMNVTGNSSISARLVSIPAPPQFLETIQDFLNPSESDDG
ncbi:MAG: OmpA family protein, partial [Pseudomonadota bacterium]